MRVLKAIILAVTLATVSLTLRSASADLEGTVKFDGKLPRIPEITAIKNDPTCLRMHKNPVYEESLVVGDNGELMNVVVSIDTPAGKPFAAPIPDKSAVLDQQGCMYVPHVVACMVGQAVEARSGDPCLHNVHTFSLINLAMNFGEAARGVKKLTPFVAVETFKVKCDVHPWMSAWVRVLDNPYFAVTDDAGKFTIDTKGIPDGEYTVTAWQEKFQAAPLQQKVTLKNGKSEKPLDFVFKP